MNGVRLSRDAAVTGAAVVMLVFEVAWGGGRPAVLTALTSILLSPLLMRADEARKNGKTVQDGE